MLSAQITRQAVGMSRVEGGKFCLRNRKDCISGSSLPIIIRLQEGKTSPPRWCWLGLSDKPGRLWSHSGGGLSLPLLGVISVHFLQKLLALERQRSRSTTIRTGVDKWTKLALWWLSCVGSMADEGTKEVEKVERGKMGAQS